MAIKGGSDTPYKNVYVRELREGGAVHKDGFVQVQPAGCKVLNLLLNYYKYILFGPRSFLIIFCNYILCPLLGYS